MSRYIDRLIFDNSNELYEEMLEQKDLKFISHYGTPNFIYPSAEQMGNLSLTRHIWNFGDRYYKLAHKHYGDSTLWYVIAWFNKRPTDAHCFPGDVILIPKPLNVVFKFLTNRR
tara:strand:- start:563 stop:904 length:342 start_codon:yes stop_codon:yes gene_type:complete